MGVGNRTLMDSQARTRSITSMLPPPWNTSSDENGNELMSSTFISGAKLGKSKRICSVFFMPHPSRLMKSQPNHCLFCMCVSPLYILVLKQKPLQYYQLHMPGDNLKQCGLITMKNRPDTCQTSLCPSRCSILAEHN